MKFYINKDLWSFKKNKKTLVPHKLFGEDEELTYIEDGYDLEDIEEKMRKIVIPLNIIQKYDYFKADITIDREYTPLRHVEYNQEGKLTLEYVLFGQFRLESFKLCSDGIKLGGLCG